MFKSKKVQEMFVAALDHDVDSDEGAFIVILQLNQMPQVSKRY